MEIYLSSMKSKILKNKTISIFILALLFFLLGVLIKNESYKNVSYIIFIVCFILLFYPGSRRHKER